VFGGNDIYLYAQGLISHNYLEYRGLQADLLKVFYEFFQSLVGNDVSDVSESGTGQELGPAIAVPLHTTALQLENALSANSVKIIIL
jgi:hypothetical protein